MYVSVVPTPLGNLMIEADDRFVTSILFREEPREENPGELTLEAARQFDEYFSGKRLRFDFPFKQTGSEFSQSVWNQLLAIEPGAPISYQALSKRLKKPLAIRAIASANGRNLLTIVVPCHRVIGSNGDLVGYSGGLWRKKWLLEHEAKMTETGQAVLTF